MITEMLTHQADGAGVVCLHCHALLAPLDGVDGTWEPGQLVCRIVTEHGGSRAYRAPHENNTLPACVIVP